MNCCKENDSTLLGANREFLLQNGKFIEFMYQEKKQDFKVYAAFFEGYSDVKTLNKISRLKLHVV